VLTFTSLPDCSEMTTCDRQSRPGESSATKKVGSSWPKEMAVRGHGWMSGWVVVSIVCVRYGAIRSLAHRHRHSRASRDRKTALSGHTDISNVDFVHGLVDGCCRGVQSADSVPSDHGEEIKCG
jgi:hypothetical protein